MPVREEGQKVYIYVTPDDEEGNPEPVIVYDFETGKSITGDMLVYDFTLSRGDHYQAPAFDTTSGPMAYMADYEVIDTYVECYDGILYNSMIVRCVCGTVYPEQIKIVEGVGSLSGLLPFPLAISTVIGYNRTYYNLLSVRDTSGNVIYQSPLAGIEDVVTETNEKPTSIYDLYGKAVKKPLPGSIYIVDGKKILYK